MRNAVTDTTPSGLVVVTAPCGWRATLTLPSGRTVSWSGTSREAAEAWAARCLAPEPEPQPEPEPLPLEGFASFQQEMVDAHQRSRSAAGKAARLGATAARWRRLILAAVPRSAGRARRAGRRRAAARTAQAATADDGPSDPPPLPRRFGAFRSPNSRLAAVSLALFALAELLAYLLTGAAVALVRP